MGKVYYKDSFPIEIQLLDCQGEAIAIPYCDWQARIYTPDSNRFVVIRQKCSASGQPAMEGWKPSADGMRISAVLNNHGLHPGPLLAEFNFDLSDDEMPDGKRRIRRHYDLGVYLSSDQCCCLPSAAEVKVVLPIIKGDKGDAMRWDDMTDAERQELVAEVALMIRDSMGATGETLSDDEVKGMVDEVFGSDASSPVAPGDGDTLLTSDEARDLVNHIFS